MRQEKETKGIQISKKELKLLADGLVPYIEKP